jgi:hypothetical protein
MKDLRGDRAKENPSEPAVTVRRHHDKVNLVLFCIRHDTFGRIAFQKSPSYRNVSAEFGNEQFKVLPTTFLVFLISLSNPRSRGGGKRVVRQSGRQHM